MRMQSTGEILHAHNDLSDEGVGRWGDPSVVYLTNRGSMSYFPRSAVIKTPQEGTPAPRLDEP
jgi:hypothetical protein